MWHVVEVGYYPKTLWGYRVPEKGGRSMNQVSNGSWLNFSMAEFQEKFP
jgi:hypothetical protein